MTIPTQQYSIERNGDSEYIVVQCPEGHLNKGLKAGEVNIKQTLTCATCGCQWTLSLPPVLFYEAVE